MKIVIIGGGAAGIATATHLRRRDENAEIIILEKNKEFGVVTSALPYVLANIISNPNDIIGATVEQMKHIFKIEVKLEHEVIDIDRKNKVLNVEAKTPISYDKLVIATGAIQLRPDIEGVLGDNIFTLRDMATIDKIKTYYEATGAKKVLILGGGNVGLAAAEAFIRLGAKVSLVEEKPHVIPYCDPEIMRRLENHLQKFGVKLYLNKRINAFCDNYAILESGTQIKYDLAIIATGVRPDVKLPIMADINLGRSGGILVNEYMQTNDEDIFAAGANVEFYNAITKQPERWPSAPRSVAQGKIIADYLCGTKTPFKKSLACEINQIFGYSVAFCGANSQQLSQAGIKHYHLYLLQNNCDVYMPTSQQMLLKLLFGDDGKILGLQGIGMSGIDTRINVVANMINLGATVYDLAQADIAYAPPYSCANDALKNLGSLAVSVLKGEILYYDFQDIGNEDIFLVDIRQPERFEERHLPNAVNFPLTSLRNNLAELPRDKKIVVYCSHGYGAYLAYCILRERGFDNARLLNTPYDLSFDL